MFTGFYLTNKGANLLAKSQAGVVINFTKVGIGKGDLPPGTSITSVTALFNKVKDLPIAGVSANNGQAQIGFQFVNIGITASFLWKELGLYATDPDEGEILYAYGYTTEPDPIPSESQLVEFLFNMIVKISNTTQITATIDQSLIYATNAVATETSNGLMTKEDKTKLDGIEENANNYTHPTGDGNLHVPATGTTNNRKVLIAGATAESAAWGTLTAKEVGALSSESSFYADLEAYYGNTKLISDFQDLSGWSTGGTVSLSQDTSNIKLGKASLRLTEIDNTTGAVYAEKNNINPIDLTKLNCGEESTDNDYLNLVIYISDVTKIQNIYIGLDNSPIYNELKHKRLLLNSSELVNGWNFIKFKKSRAITYGGGTWDNIQSIRVLWTSLANAQNAYVSFQLIQLVKADPVSLIEMPNPFQKFGVRDFEIKSNEWFVGKENSQLVMKCIDSPGNKNVLISQKTFSDFIMTVSRITTSVSVDAYTCWYVNDTNFVEFFISSVTNKATIRKTVNGIMTVEAESVPPAKNSDMDIIIWEITKSGDEINAELKIQGRQEKTNLNAKNIGIPSPGAMSLGYSGSAKGDYYLSASITEISHAHHADVAEIARDLEYKNLKIPSIDVGDYSRYKMVVLSSNLPVDNVGVRELVIDLGSPENTELWGMLKIIVSSRWGTLNASGAIEKYINIHSFSVISSQSSSYTYLGEQTKKIFSISDIYIENRRKKIKILQQAGSKNDIYVTMQGIGVFHGLDRATISDWKPSTETFVEPSMSPVETRVTTGFASGWSGEIRYSKTQEGLLLCTINLEKTSDISVNNELIYTMPLGYRPKTVARANVVGLSGVNNMISGSLVELVLRDTGALELKNVGSVTANVRKCIGLQIAVITV